MTRVGTFRPARRATRVPLRERLLAIELARLLSARQTRRRFRDDLLPLFRRIWQRGGDSTWTCAELARRGLVDPRSTVQLGRDLRRQFERGEPVGVFVLQHRGHERDGVTWSLARLR